MSATPTEATIALLRGLIEACRYDKIDDFTEEWLTTVGARQYVSARLEQAIVALTVLNNLGEYMVEHHV